MTTDNGQGTKVYELVFDTIAHLPVVQEIWKNHRKIK